MDIKANVNNYGGELQKPYNWGKAQLNSASTKIKNVYAFDQMDVKNKVIGIAAEVLRTIAAVFAVVLGLVPYAIGAALKAATKKEEKPVEQASPMVSVPQRAPAKAKSAKAIAAKERQEAFVAKQEEKALRNAIKAEGFKTEPKKLREGLTTEKETSSKVRKHKRASAQRTVQHVAAKNTYAPTSTHTDTNHNRFSVLESDVQA